MRTVRAKRLLVGALVSACSVWGAAGLEAQVRGAEQRAVSPRSDVSPAEQSRQAEVLVDRFARRVGQALGLSPDLTRRLRTELQTTRIQRARVTARVRSIRQELARLVAEPAGDQERVAALLDEAMSLEVDAAEILVDEQRRLSAFLTPVQRARVLWLRQRMAQAALQRDRPGGVP